MLFLDRPAEQAHSFSLLPSWGIGPLMMPCLPVSPLLRNLVFFPALGSRDELAMGLDCLHVPVETGLL